MAHFLDSQFLTLLHVLSHPSLFFTSNSNYKLMLFSSHDTTLVSLLLALGIFNNTWPDFAADVAFELYRDKVDLVLLWLIFL